MDPAKHRPTSPVSLHMIPSEESSLSYASKSAPTLHPPPAPPLTPSPSLPLNLDFSSPAVLASAVTNRARTSWAAARPWGVFFSARALNIPAFRDVTERVEGNLSIWRGNYEVIAAAWCAFALVMSLGRVLAAAALTLAVERIVRRRIERKGELGSLEKAAVVGAVLVVVWVTGVGRLIVESAGVAAGTVAVHAVLRDETEEGALAMETV